MNLKTGDLAPDFALPDQDGKIHRLRDYRGEWLLIYFYPKDMTPGCTMQACGLRDSSKDMHRLGMATLGISVDSVASHRKFADKHDLQFPLLADTEKEVVTKYGVWGKKKFMGREYLGTRRESVLIDPEGRVATVYEDVKPAAHAGEVIAKVTELAGKK